MIDTQKIAGYQILRTLGRNTSGGRVTYLAQKGDRQVVIKQFQFASGADWSDMKELEREISILKSLDHPQIPHYIESFESDQGFCLVQEYIPAPSLAEVRSRSLEQIQDIGRQLLEILTYLQALHPAVLHRDIKPENILRNDQGRVFLVDFGFSRLGSAEVAASSIMIGTTGFIPPELFSGREPTKASDLYSLGATLLSLITGTPSANMARLLSDDFRFSDAVYDEVDRPYANWLRKMTAVRVSDRYTDAATALAEMDPSKSLAQEDAIQLSGIRTYKQANGILVKKVVYGDVVCSLSGKYGFQKKKAGFAYRDKFYCELKPGEDIFAGSIPLVKLHFYESSRHSMSVNIENAAKNLLAREAAVIEWYEEPKRGFELKAWHLYTGFIASIIVSAGVLSAVIHPLLTSATAPSVNVTTAPMQIKPSGLPSSKDTDQSAADLSGQVVELADTLIDLVEIIVPASFFVIAVNMIRNASRNDY